MRHLGMGRSALVTVFALAMIAAFLLPAAREGSAAVGVKVGDYWSYSTSEDLEGMSISITEKMKVTGTEGSGSSQVFVLALSGSGDVSGNFSGIIISGTVDLTGEIKRLVSNFSMVSSAMNLSMSINAQGQSATMEMGYDMTFSPAFDDFIGDNGLGHGGTLVSRSTVTVTVSMDMVVMGQHESMSNTDTEQIVQTIQIASSNESVSVKAGSFDCYKCTLTMDMGGSSDSMTYYYSGEAGNYVKMVGTSSQMIGGLGAGDLQAFSYGGRGSTSSILSGVGLLIIVIVVVLVIVAVIMVLMVRRRGGTMVQMPMPPPGYGAPPGTNLPPPPESNVPPPPMAPPPAGPGPGI